MIKLFKILFTPFIFIYIIALIPIFVIALICSPLIEFFLDLVDPIVEEKEVQPNQIVTYKHKGIVYKGRVNKEIITWKRKRSSYIYARATSYGSIFTEKNKEIDPGVQEIWDKYPWTKPKR